MAKLRMCQCGTPGCAKVFLVITDRWAEMYVLKTTAREGVVGLYKKNEISIEQANLLIAGLNGMPVPGEPVLPIAP